MEFVDVEDGREFCQFFSFSSGISIGGKASFINTI